MTQQEIIDRYEVKVRTFKDALASGMSAEEYGRVAAEEWNRIKPAIQAASDAP